MRVICAATQACKRNRTYRIPLGTISADWEQTDSFRADRLLGWRICRQIAAVRLFGVGPAALMLCAGMKQLEASEPLGQRGGSRRGSPNCPLFYPEAWMEMQRVCQVELGGMTLQLTLLFTYLFLQSWPGGLRLQVISRRGKVTLTNAWRHLIVSPWWSETLHTCCRRTVHEWIELYCCCFHQSLFADSPI